MTAGPGDIRPIPDPTTLTTAQLRRELSSLRELVEARLDGMDRATRLLDETVNRTPTAIQIAIDHLKELHDEKFASISLQFEARDDKVEAISRTQSAALEAALAAADKLTALQNEANQTALEKLETTTQKQFDQLTVTVNARYEVLDTRIGEMKERIDRGEGSQAGAAGFRTERRLDVGQLVAVVATLLALASFILYVTKK